MSDESTNPYSTPASDVSPEAPTSDAFAEFPRFSAWWVLLLTFVTYGLYPYYWVISRTPMFNRAVPDHPISPALVWTVVVIGVSSTVFDFALEFGLYAPGLHLAETLVNAILAITLVNMLFWIYLAFEIRTRINFMTGASTASPLWSNAFLTFFFTPLYPAYKINQIKDAHETL